VGLDLDLEVQDLEVQEGEEEEEEVPALAMLGELLVVGLLLVEVLIGEKGEEEGPHAPG
jgi:hypothetical protein